MPKKDKPIYNRFPLWELDDPDLEYLKLPDTTLDEFDKEFPDIERQAGDWELIEMPIWIRLLRGYRRLLVKEREGNNQNPGSGPGLIAKDS